VKAGKVVHEKAPGDKKKRENPLKVRAELEGKAKDAVEGDDKLFRLGAKDLEPQSGGPSDFSRKA